MTTHEDPPRPAAEFRQWSRRKWFALALSVGLLVVLSALPWFSAERAQQADGNAIPEIAQLSGQDRKVTSDDGWTDLSSMIDLDRDVIFGSWKRRGDVLSGSDPGRDSVAARLLLPCRPPSGYELSFRLKRIEGETAGCVILPVADRSVALVLSGFPDLPGETTPLTGLQLLDGKALPLSPERVRGPNIETGRAYQVKVRVLARDGSAAITLELDDDRILDWEGKVERLEVAPVYQLHDSRHLGFGVFNATVELHDIEIRVLEGEAVVGGLRR